MTPDNRCDVNDPTTRADERELRLVAARYVAELIAEVGEPGQRERARADLIARRIGVGSAERST